MLIDTLVSARDIGRLKEIAKGFIRHGLDPGFHMAIEAEPIFVKWRARVTSLK